MTQGFTWHRRGKRCVATFSAFEADLLRSLAGQVVELLRNETATPRAENEDDLEALLDFSGPTSEPDDPVLARLFPNAYPGDEEAAADFRRFTEGTLRDGKAKGAALVIDTLEQSGLEATPADGTFVDVELDQETAQVWLRALNDMRLAIGTRLEVEEGDEESWADRPADDPQTQVYEVYMWLGYVQETLVAAIH